LTIENANGPLTIADVLSIVHLIEYLDWDFWVGSLNDDPQGPLYIQVMFDAWDLKTETSQVQYGRKWFISRHSTTSEIVQTALMAVLAAQEHEVREEFRYRGKAVFGPHFDVEELSKRLPAMDLRSPVKSPVQKVIRNREQSKRRWSGFLKIAKRALG
jgi:hypothetical protein